MNRKLISFISLFVYLASFSLYGEVRGKVDLGPTLLYVDILKSGKTEETLRMYGFKADSTILVYQGLAIKPSLLLGWGHGRLVSGTIAVGYYVPITESFKILPNVGMNWSYLKTTLDFKEFGLYGLRERFRSESPLIGLDFSYSLTSCWTVIGSYQYAWCKTDTKIGDFPSDRSHSCGPNYSLGVEYAYNDQWAINMGFGYNISLSKEKHGIRGKGLKLGAAYYF